MKIQQKKTGKVETINKSNWDKLKDATKRKYNIIEQDKPPKVADKPKKGKQSDDKSE